jgi:cell division protein FtsZ
MINFDLPKEQSSIIKVIGVGGGGSNAVNHMYRLGIKGVDFIVCNTDKQALDISPVPVKIQLGETLTEGMGAGSLPEVGRNAAIENINDIKEILSRNTRMVFITAGMGGGTGTGAAPIIAAAAKEMGILTVGIVTIPFAFEGKKRRIQAEEGLNDMKKNVDTLLVISNDKLREIHGNLKLAEAFAHADNVLTNAAKSIAEIISITLHINVDFKDVRTVMQDSGVAIMGSASATGDNRAIRAVEAALNSPLLNDNNIEGARYVLLNITSGVEEITMDELGEITDYIQEAAGQTAELITGYGVDETLGDKVNVTIIATGFKARGVELAGIETMKKPEKIVRNLEEAKPVEEVAPVAKKEEVKAEEPNALEPFLIKRSSVSEETKQEVAAPVVSEVTPVVNEVVDVVSPVVEEAQEEPQMELKIVEPAAQVEEPVMSFEEAIQQVEEAPAVEEVQPPALQQVSFEFEVASVTPVREPVSTVVNEPAMKIESSREEDEKLIQRLQSEEQVRKAQERISKLKELSLKLKTPNGLAELEKEPAYRRRNINLESTPHSSESQVSRFTLSEGDDKKVEIKPNNSFLHDNVD